MNDIAYRDATPADGPELDAMARAIWLETFAHGSSAEDAAAYLAKAYGPNGTLLRDLNAGAARFRLAIADGRMVGYVKINAPWLEDAEPGVVQLSQLYVVGDRHGQGIAQTLMDWAIGEARASGAPALLLTVWEENHRARRFYKKTGFSDIGTYAFVIGEQVDTDIVMRLAL